MFSKRQQQILNALKSEGKVTGDALAAALGVSKRTIYRDLTALTDAGIAVRTEGGPGGGIWLASDDAPPVDEVNLQADAAASGEGSLPASSPAGADEAPAPQETAASHLQSAAAASPAREPLRTTPTLPTPHVPVPSVPAPNLAAKPANLAATLRERIHLDLTSPLLEDAPWQMTVDLLQDAIFSNHTLRVQFVDTSEQPIIEPYGLVAKASGWYLVWRQNGAFVADRLARIQSAEIMDRRFERQVDFNLAAWWQESSHHFVQHAEQYRFVALVRRSRVEFLRLYVDGGLQVEPMDTQRVRVRFEVASPEAAVMIVLGLGQDAEVIEPEELPLMVRRAVAVRPIHDAGRAPSVSFAAPSAPSAPRPASVKPAPAMPAYRDPEPLPARKQGPELFPSAPVGTIVHG